MKRSGVVARAQGSMWLLCAAVTAYPAHSATPSNGKETAAPTSAQLGRDTRAALDKALDEGFAKSGMPGVNVGLWIPGKGRWIASRGVADLKTGRRMTADLQAPIGSVTKTFTGTLALQSVAEGKLRLDETIDRWYPRLPKASAISIRMLLNHSSGFADISQLQLDVHCAHQNRLVSPDKLIALGTALPRAPFAPGKGHRYSSVNTIILGRILEKISGKPFSVLMNERLLEPLALHRTKLDTDGKLEPPFSHGYTDFCPKLPRRTDTSGWPQISFAAGALASTLYDLHAWGVSVGEGFGLTPALRKTRIDDELGIAVQRDTKNRSVLSFGHGGSEPGYSANFQYYPCTGAVWVVMGNGDGGTGEAFVAVIKALQPVVERLAVSKVGCRKPLAGASVSRSSAGFQDFWHARTRRCKHAYAAGEVKNRSLSANDRCLLRESSP